MPPPRKPHPRSLTALFGPAKPKVAPKKRCPKGHLQPVRWRSGQPCTECQTIAARLARIEDAKAEKAEYRERMGPPPMVLTITTWDTQRVARFVIPPRLAAQRKARDKRRGRRRGRGI